MIRLFVLALALVACGPSREHLLAPSDARSMALGQDGPFGVDRVVRSVRVRVDETIDVDVMVPIDGTTSAQRRGAPVVIVVQGGLVARERYDWIGTHLASRGFVVLLPDHAFELAFFAQGNALDVLHTLRAASARPDDALAGVLAPGPVAIVGHSLGGVVAAYAWNDAPNDVAHLLLLGSYPDGAIAPRTHGRALSLLGTRDGRTSRESWDRGVSALETSGVPITGALVDGMSHMQWADEVTASEAANDGVPTVDTGVARRRAGVLIDALFEDFAGRDGSLLDDPSRWPEGLAP